MENSFKARLEEARSTAPAVTPHKADARKLSDSNTLFIDLRGAEDIRRTTSIILGALHVSLRDLGGTSDDYYLPEELASHSHPIMPPTEEIGPMKTIHGPHNQRGFLALGLGVALFAVYSAIGAGVVANHEGKQDVARTSQTEMVAQVSHSDSTSRPEVKR